jgi:hypothetical protein
MPLRHLVTIAIIGYTTAVFCSVGAHTSVAQSSSTLRQTAQATPQLPTQAPDLTQLPPNGHEIFGTISTVNGDVISIVTRNGTQIDVDATEAVQAYQSVTLLVDEPVRIIGRFDSSNLLHATVITRAKQSRELWPSDR